MTYKYSYKTSDGIRHEGEIDAPGRDEAFSALREQGIRPIRLLAKYDPRTVAGHGRWWMWLSAVLFLLAVVILLVVLLFIPREAETPSAMRPGRGIESQVVELPSGDRIARPRARKPISGLYPFSKAVDKVFAASFAHPAEIYLARFAQPGLDVPHLSEISVLEMLEDDLRDSLDEPIVIRAEDSREVVELKRIVSGLKEETMLLLNSGKSLEEVKSWLEGRQQMESDYRKQIIRRSEDGFLSLEEANRLLVSMGFAPKGDSGVTQNTNIVQQVGGNIEE